MSQELIELQVENWNLKHPLKHPDEGTPVNVRRDDGTIIATKTRSAAFLLGGHTPCIMLEGISGAFLLDRVEAR